MAHYDTAALRQWHANAQRECADMGDSALEDSVMFGSRCEESWIDLPDEEHDACEDDAEHITASLTTILGVKPHHPLDGEDEDEDGDELQNSQFRFMELSDTSLDTSAGSQQRQHHGHPLNNRSSKRRKLRSAVEPTISPQATMMIGIIMAVSFSAGYALGSTKRALV